MQINELEPKIVFYYFSELAKIPRGSGNTKRVEEYCLKFAEERDLKTYHDDYGNVMIFKDGTSGYKHSAPVILQGHLDMVCEKLPSCKKDMEKEGIDVIVDGDVIRADGTTLGGDDGIAVAYILAILDSDGIPHPPIEALLTTDEETGLRGASSLDASKLRGKRLINIDSEEEGIITVSCAGAVRVSCKIPVTRRKADALAAKKITIGGLRGGHSGIDIAKNRKNAAKLLGDLFFALTKNRSAYIASVSSGGRLNVITPTAEAVICFEEKNRDEVDKIISDFEKHLKTDYAAFEPDAFVSSDDTDAVADCADADGTAKITVAMTQAPYGIRAMNSDIPDLVQTSSNPGEVTFAGDSLELHFMIRSNSDADKIDLVNSLESFVRYLGGTFEIGDDYPAWEYRPESAMRYIMAAVYEELYGEKPVINSIHAGLECGILTEKLPGADMVSIGPTMHGVHTPEERLDVGSVGRVWKYLLQVLKMLK